MNPRSFRVRIAAWSGLVSAIVLVAMGIGLWEITYRFNLDRLDREIRNIGQANLDRAPGSDHWARLQNALEFVSGASGALSFQLWVKHQDRVIFKADGWPAEIDPERFSVPSGYEGAFVPQSGAPFPPPPRRGEEISARNPGLPRKTPAFFTSRSGASVWRLGAMGNPYVTLVVAADMNEFNSRMSRLRLVYSGVLLVALLVVAGGAWLVATRATRPIAELTRAAEGLTARDLGQRIPARSTDHEFNRLIHVFNGMLARLENSFAQATRFSADASHELKTPLARLQAEIEMALLSAGSDSSMQMLCSSLLDEISRLKAVVHKLLLLSLADAGKLPIQPVEVNLSELVRNLAEDCRTQAQGLEAADKIAAEVYLMADADLLEQALQNLSANAIKYNCEKGRVHLELAIENKQAVVRVSNTGPGIPREDAPKIFERFFRADRSRSARVEGAGLGLSLSREIARAHGGNLVLEKSDSSVTCFRLEMPVASRR